MLFLDLSGESMDSRFYSRSISVLAKIIFHIASDHFETLYCGLIENKVVTLCLLTHFFTHRTLNIAGFYAAIISIVCA